jgi:hypothetical protein
VGGGGGGGGSKFLPLYTSTLLSGRVSQNIKRYYFLDACFNCGKDGHKSFECSEPKKAGGGRSGGGDRSSMFSIDC